MTTEPCECCGAPVACWQDTWWEYVGRGRPDGAILGGHAAVFVVHQPERCRAERERQHGASGAEGMYQWHSASGAARVDLGKRTPGSARSEEPSGSASSDPQVR